MHTLAGASLHDTPPGSQLDSGMAVAGDGCDSSLSSSTTASDRLHLAVLGGGNRAGPHHLTPVNTTDGAASAAGLLMSPHAHHTQSPAIKYIGSSQAGRHAVTGSDAHGLPALKIPSKQAKGPGAGAPLQSASGTKYGAGPLPAMPGSGVAGMELHGTPRTASWGSSSGSPPLVGPPRSWAWDYALMPLLLPLMAAWWAAAFVMAWLLTFTVIPSVGAGVYRVMLLNASCCWLWGCMCCDVLGCAQIPVHVSMCCGFHVCMAGDTCWPWAAAMPCIPLHKSGCSDEAPNNCAVMCMNSTPSESGAAAKGCCQLSRTVDAMQQPLINIISACKH